MVKAGLDEGRFLVRTRDNKPGEYVLCVVYKGKPTHHLIAKNEAGIYAINKKTFGEYNKVNRVSCQRLLLMYLKTPLCGNKSLNYRCTRTSFGHT